MLLSARFLNQVSSVNSYEYADNVQFTQSDTVNVYFQLVDLTLDKATAGFSPAGRRYMPASGALLTATLVNIDSSKQLARAATQAFPTADPSIWYLSVLATDLIRGTCDLQLSLNEGGKVTSGRVSAGVLISSSGSF